MDWREVKALADDDVRVRNMAKVLLATPGLTEKQHDFLSDMAKFKGSISTRQGETLLCMRDELRQVSSVDGFSVKNLLRGCYQARLDLSDEDAEFIRKLERQNMHKGLNEAMTIKWRDGWRLKSCAKKLGLID